MIKIIFGMIIGGFIVYHNPDIGIDIVNFFINFLNYYIPFDDNY